MGLGHDRAAVTLEMTHSWYEGVMKFLKKEVPDYNQLLADPRRIFNADENGFPLQSKAGKPMAPTRARHIYQVVTNSKTQITVMVGFNAFGDYTPPMILFPGERKHGVGLVGFPKATYACTSNGWMDLSTFVAYLQSLHDFVRSKQIMLPVLLFVDGHSTHMTLEAAVLQIA